MKRKYYIAYGSNMDLEHMKYRCPDAVLVGSSEVKGYELLFKGSHTGAYATIEEKEENIVPVLIWKISVKDEENLDHYEGYPRFYYKKELEIMVEGKMHMAMVYIMDERRVLGLPCKTYYTVIEKAYKKFGFDLEILESAIGKSTPKEGADYGVWNKKRNTTMYQRAISERK